MNDKILIFIAYCLYSVAFILLLGWMTYYVNPFIAAAVTYIFSAFLFWLMNNYMG